MNLTTQLANQKANSSNGKGELFSNDFHFLNSNLSKSFQASQNIISIISIIIA